MSKRVALVTGGIGGIGTAVCIELVNHDRLVIAGNLPEEKIAGQVQMSRSKAGCIWDRKYLYCRKYSNELLFF